MLDFLPMPANHRLMLTLSNRQICRAMMAALTLAGLAALTGCQSSNFDPAMASAVSNAQRETAQSMLLAEGDTVRLTFPGAPKLDSVQIIRRDGKISVEANGEFQAAGLTPRQLEDALLKRLGPQLLVKEVSVAVQSSTFTIYVVGAVERSGKLVADRRLTPLQAVIEAGINFQRSNLKRVVVLRVAANGETEKCKLNLSDVFHGKSSPPFLLQPQDIIYVPEKFNWY